MSKLTHACCDGTLAKMQQQTIHQVTLHDLLVCVFQSCSSRTPANINIMQVQQVFDDMYKAGLQPNIMTYITLLSSYAELGWWQPAVHILNHMCQPRVCLQLLS